MTTSLDPIRSANLSDQVYESVRNALVEGKYEPGQRLTIAGLANELGVSGTPVREAIFRLVTERALEMKAATEIRVPEMTPNQFREIQRIGILLQGEAAEVAAQIISSEQLRSLEGIQEQLLVTVAEEDLTRATSLNRQFHFEIMVAADMPMILATVEATYAMKGPVLKLYLQETHIQEKFEQVHHEAMLEGLRTGDGMKARQAMESDVGSCDDVINWILKRQQATEAA